MTDELPRAAAHEAAHCVTALHFSLPLLEVFIFGSGGGRTRYARHFSYAETACWAVTAFAGPLAERAVFGSAPTAGDDAVVARMLAVLNLNWTAVELAGHRHTAQPLVRREQHAIMVLADELLRHRRLTGDDVAMI